MRLKFFLIGLSLNTVIAGCSKEMDASTVAVRKNIAWCEKLVTDRNVEAPANVRYDLFKRTFDQIAEIADEKQKTAMAKEFSSLVKRVDLSLSDTDFMGFVDRVSRFKSLFDWSVWSLLDAKADSEYTLQFLIDGMAKYRKACFSIPIVGRSENESAETYAKKCEAIIALASDYEYAAIALEKSQKGHLQSFPVELHNKYIAWKKSAIKCPKSGDVRDVVRKMLRKRGKDNGSLSNRNWADGLSVLPD